MNTIREHIIIKFTIVILVASLVTPSVVKLSHVFANHKHEVCVSESTEHFHNLDLECEFYKFKLTGECYFGLNYISLEPFVKVQNSIPFYYKLLNNHQQLNVTLRGPPQILV